MLRLSRIRCESVEPVAVSDVILLTAEALTSSPYGSRALSALEKEVARGRRTSLMRL